MRQKPPTRSFVNCVSAPIFPHEVFTPAKQGRIPGSKSGFLQVVACFLLIEVASETSDESYSAAPDEPGILNTPQGITKKPPAVNPLNAKGLTKVYHAFSMRDELLEEHQKLAELARREEIRPPQSSKAVLPWMKANLFSTWYNSLLTLVALGFLLLVFKGFLTWAFTGAKWSVIPANLQLFAVGSYPREQIWRVWGVVYILSVLIGLSAGMWGGLVLRFALVLGGVWFIGILLPFEFSTRGGFLGAVVAIAAALFLGRGRTSFRPWILGGWLLSFPLIIVVLRGFGENGVLTSNWGGLLLTLILAIVGIVASFPLGVFLALCRQSSLPAIRWVSTAYIETVRGVPLITILFMGNVLIPIFMPDVDINQVLRMMLGITFFSAAYMAENVRGGLQGIPKGQQEAGQAVGLNYVQTMLFIVLPQALRAVIPAIVGQFIALFKDTSLVSIIGLIDLLGVAKSVIANPDWLGLQAEVYLFAAVIYFIFSYSMSYVSQKIETALGVGNH